MFRSHRSRDVVKIKYFLFTNQLHRRKNRRFSERANRAFVRDSDLGRLAPVELEKSTHTHPPRQC